MKHTTKETTEALAAIYALISRYKVAMSDGRLGYLELAGFFRDAPAVKLALEHIELIPDELLDLTEEEMPAIIADLSNVLNAWGVSHRMQDITSDVANGLAEMVPTVQILFAQAKVMMDAVNARPPSAIAADNFTREQLGA